MFDELFVCGMSRSGTTLLSTIFDSHPQISMGYELMPGKVPPPRRSAELIADALNDAGDEPKAVARRLRDADHATLGAFVRRSGRCGVVPSELAGIVRTLDGRGVTFDDLDARANVARQIVERKRLREGTAVAGFKFNGPSIDAFSAIFAKGRFVFVVRDPRDVAASHFAKEFGRSLAQIVKAWNRYTGNFTEFARRHPEIGRIVAYEDLVTDPEPVLGEIFAWLELPYDDAVLRFFDSKASIHDHGHVEKRNVERDFYPTSVDRWVTELTIDQIRDVDKGCSDLMTEHGYRRAPLEPTVSLGPKRLAKMQGSLASRKRFYRDQYARLLESFTDRYVNITWHEAAVERKAAGQRVLLIRHDIDHDIQTALRIASWEHARGLRATYCVLHTAWYYGRLEDGRMVRTTEMLEACREIQALGHEINLHNNVPVVALKEGVDPWMLLTQELRFLRLNGMRVTGTSGHGDALCRELDFFNLEMFTDTVWESKGGRRVVRNGSNQIELGRFPMARFGLSYEGYDLPRDLYITESGGRLRERHKTRGRGGLRRAERTDDIPYPRIVGVLTHPEWWDFERDSPPGTAFEAFADPGA